MQVIDEGWVTVESAARAVDMSDSTLVEWCRGGVVDSFRDRDGAHQRFVRLDDVRRQVEGIRGRPQTSLHHLIASHTSSRGSTSEARISELQGLVRGRVS